MEDLIDAAMDGEDVVVAQGSALRRIRRNCKPGQWSRVLALLDIPPKTADRQIRLAAAFKPLGRQSLRALHTRGIWVRSDIPANHLKLVRELSPKLAEIETVARENALLAGIWSHGIDEVGAKETLIKLCAFHNRSS